LKSWAEFWPDLILWAIHVWHWSIEQFEATGLDVLGYYVGEIAPRVNAERRR